MHTHRRLIVNTALMTGSSIVMRCIALVFQAWLVGHIGAAGIGLYQLVLSVSVLFATFAISGIRFAATRLISEEMGLERGAGVTGAMRRCACYALIFGLCAGTAVYFLAEPVGFLWIGDARTVRSLRITSISLPCIALSAVMDGYFTASGRVWKPTLVHLIEQLVSITCVMWFLSLAAAGDLEQSCAAVTAGGRAGPVGWNPIEGATHDIGVMLGDGDLGNMPASQRANLDIQVGNVFDKRDIAVRIPLEELLGTRTLGIINVLQHLERTVGVSPHGAQNGSGLDAAHAAGIGNRHAFDVLDDIARTCDLETLGFNTQHPARQRRRIGYCDGLRASQRADQLVVEQRA